jgi:Tol biopolymer transport system component
LIQGDIAQRTARVVRENVECPSLSPDGTRLVFKKRTDPESAREWRLAVLDLATMTETMVPGESHSIDDQAEWLDDNHVLYALQDQGPPATIAQDIWEATLDGSAPPRLVLKGAMSPAVVR